MSYPISVSKSCTIAKQGNVVRSDWNGLNVFLLHAAQAAALDLGLVPQSEKSLEYAKFVYLMGADDTNIDKIPKDVCVVYQGHHGDKSVYRADVVLPALAFSEKEGTYENTEGYNTFTTTPSVNSKQPRVALRCSNATNLQPSLAPSPANTTAQQSPIITVLGTVTTSSPRIKSHPRQHNRANTDDILQIQHTSIYLRRWSRFINRCNHDHPTMRHIPVLFRSKSESPNSSDASSLLAPIGTRSYLIDWFCVY